MKRSGVATSACNLKRSGNMLRVAATAKQGQPTKEVAMKRSGEATSACNLKRSGNMLRVAATAKQGQPGKEVTMIV